MNKEEKIEKLMTEDNKEQRKARADQKRKLWKERRDQLVEDLEEVENQGEVEDKGEKDDRLMALKERSLELKMKRQAWKLEKDLTINGGGPQWPFLLIKRPLLLTFRKGTHH